MPPRLKVTTKPKDIPTVQENYVAGTLSAAVKNPTFARNLFWNQKIHLWKGDITELEVDAIVNAANESLLGGGGVDGSIHRAAGKDLLKECRTLRGCDTGEAKITKGYLLPAKHVIHTVGPVGEKPKLLESCYRRSLEVLREKNLESLAFCCISTGIYGYPNEKAARVAISTVREWMDNNRSDANKIRHIVFCVFLDVDEQIYKRLLPEIFPMASDGEQDDEQQLNFIFTRDVILQLTKRDVHAEFSVALCKPIRCSQIPVCILEVSLKACCESHANTKKEWRRLEREHLDQCEEEYRALAGLVRSQLEHFLLGVDLWNPLQYTTRTNNKGNEDSFFCNIVKPLLHAAFEEYEGIKIHGKGHHLSCNPAFNRELLFPDYSVTIDCYDKMRGEHYLVVCETKPPGASQMGFDTDYIKLPNMMKLNFDGQIKQGCSESMMIGILVQGWKVLVFYMCLKHEAIYEIKSIGHFDLIMDRIQLCKLINICPILLKAKRIMEASMEHLQQQRPSFKASYKA
ncbi:O-acetyl-ADP-ribose deacetylase macrod1 [Haplosporangium sp. Z 11]|nr:O-acetyl-ADP-ribose deacetylase macrod1 [Haplosporangium sp. Z 11]